MLDLADYAAAMSRRLPGWVLLPTRGRTVPSLHSLRVKDTYRPRERDEAELLTWNIPDTEGPEVTPPTPVRLRSKRSEHVTYVEFRNNTRGVVRLLWIDFHGNEVAYPLIAAGQTFRQHTFLTHPWIFRDVETGRQCVTDGGQTVFFPDNNVARCTIGGLALTTAECPALPWRPSRHHLYPPNARAAVRQLLLCHRRISKCGADGPAPLTSHCAMGDGDGKAAADGAAARLPHADAPAGAASGSGSGSPDARGTMQWLCLPRGNGSGNRRYRASMEGDSPPFRNTRSRKAAENDPATASASARDVDTSSMVSSDDIALSLDGMRPLVAIAAPAAPAADGPGAAQPRAPPPAPMPLACEPSTTTTLGDLPHELILDIAALVVPQRVSEGAPADLSFYTAAHMPYTPEKAWLVASQEPEKSRLVGQPPPLDFEALYRATFNGGGGTADHDGAEAGNRNGQGRNGGGGGPFGHLLRWSTLRGMVHNCLSCACLSLCALAFASLAR